MKKINNKVLVILPYISTSWSQVQSLFVRDDILYIALNNGESVAIPKLLKEEIENIFSSHSAYLEISKDPVSEKTPKMVPPFSFPGSSGPQSPFRISFGTMDNMGNIMQHNPEMAHAPELPTEIIEKVVSIIRIVAPEEVLSLPKAEPHCNCVHCQIIRAMQEETVSDADLQFCQWEIISENNKIYTVINRNKNEEKFKVCLDPIGCTCGHEGCVHIVAVLKS